jgi:hypothetical protein
MKTVKPMVLILFAVFLAFLPGCSVKPDKTANLPSELQRLESEGYFRITGSFEEGQYGPVIILPEIHNSRLIQAEVALALNRLYENAGLSRIALEGMFAGETFDKVKIKNLSEEAAYRTRLDLLESAEIKAPEFMYLAKKLQVFGIEDSFQYEVKEPEAQSRLNALLDYFIASIRLDKDLANVHTLIERLYEPMTELEFNRILKELAALNPETEKTLNLVNEYFSKLASASSPRPGRAGTQDPSARQSRTSLLTGRPDLTKLLEELRKIRGEPIRTLPSLDNTEDPERTMLVNRLREMERKYGASVYLSNGSKAGFDRFIGSIESASREKSSDDSIAFINFLVASVTIETGYEELNHAIFEEVENNSETWREAIKNVIALSETSQEQFGSYIQERYGVFITEPNLEQEIELLKKLRDKCETSGQIKIRNKIIVRNYLDFLETTITRSHTMSDNVLKALQKKNSPIAMIIGAAHTEGIEEDFKTKGVKYYVLEPRGLGTYGWDGKLYSSGLSGPEYENKKAEKPVFSSETLEKFLGLSHNFRPAFLMKNNAFNTLYTIQEFVRAVSGSGSPPGPPYTRKLNGVQFELVSNLADGSSIFRAVDTNVKSPKLLYMRVMQLEESTGAELTKQGEDAGSIAAVEQLEQDLVDMIARLEEDSYNSVWSRTAEAGVQITKYGNMAVAYAASLSRLESLDLKTSIIELNPTR